MAHGVLFRVLALSIWRFELYKQTFKPFNPFNH